MVGCAGAHLEGEGLVEGGVERLLLHLGLVLLLLVGEQEHLDIGVRGAAHVQGWQFSGLEDPHGQLKGREAASAADSTMGSSPAPSSPAPSHTTQLPQGD